MRIAFVTHGYPRWDGDVAGAFIERLAVALRGRGHEVLVLAPADHGRGGEEERSGVSVRRVRYASAARETLAYQGNMVQAARSPGGFVAAVGMVRALRRAIDDACRNEGVEVVHAHWWVPAGVAAWRARSAPYLVTLHGTDVALLRGSLLARLLARRVLRAAAQVSAVSQYLAESAGAAVDCSPTQITVQPMPVDLPDAGADGGGEGVVVVGRLTAQKRVHLVLEALAQLAARGVRLPLTVVGDGPERAALEALARRLDLADRITFTGMVAPGRLPTALAGADVMAFTAQGEGFGLAAAEALVLGIPVVALSDGGGLLDVVPADGAGRVVPPYNAALLGAALSDLARDPAARTAARAAGVRLRERLAPDKVAEVFEKVYTLCLASKRSTSFGSTAWEK